MIAELQQNVKKCHSVLRDNAISLLSDAFTPSKSTNYQAIWEQAWQCGQKEEDNLDALLIPCTTYITHNDNGMKACLWNDMILYHVWKRLCLHGL